MKKIFTAIASIALCATAANAQTMQILSLGLGIPGIDEPQLVGLGISPNGKYVCGSIENGDGYFIADIENNEIKFQETSDPEGAELRHVDNNGLAIGYDGPGFTYSFDGTSTVLQVPSSDYKYVLGEALSNDGSLLVGSLVARTFDTLAAYSKDGGAWTLLPAGTEEQIGDFAEAGSAAKYVSGDGKVILGFVGSFGPAVLWTANDEGEYEFAPLYTRYVVLTEEEMAAGEKELYNLIPMALSNNGKYAALRGLVMSDEGYRSVPAIYDVEAKELKVYSDMQEIDLYGLGLTPTAIADDGTMIGIIGSQPMYECMGSYIWKAGADSAESFSTAFPCYDESFGFPDQMGFCVPTGISADGRYVMGYGFYCEDFFDDDAFAYNVTYVIDTMSGTTGIDSAAAMERPATPEAYYSVDGKRNARLTKGINIVRMSDGSVRKVLNK